MDAAERCGRTVTNPALSMARATLGPGRLQRAIEAPLGRCVTVRAAHRPKLEKALYSLFLGSISQEVHPNPAFRLESVSFADGSIDTAEDYSALPAVSHK